MNLSGILELTRIKRARTEVVSVCDNRIIFVLKYQRFFVPSPNSELNGYVSFNIENWKILEGISYLDPLKQNIHQLTI